MKKFNLYLATLFLMLGSVLVSLSAQVPGYMGKRLNMGYGFYINPAFTAYSYGYGESRFNIQHEGFLEYATGKKFSLGFSAKFCKTSYVNKGEVQLYPNYNATSSQTEDRPSGSYSLTCQSFALYGKSFKQNYLAPWGRYFVFGLVLNRYEAKYSPHEMKVRIIQEVKSPLGPKYVQAYYSDFGYTTQSYSYLDIAIGNGKTRVYKNRITLDYGYNMQVIAMTLAILDATVGGPYTADEYIQKTGAMRVRGINRFNFYCKVGYLF